MLIQEAFELLRDRQSNSNEWRHAAAVYNEGTVAASRKRERISAFAQWCDRARSSGLFVLPEVPRWNGRSWDGMGAPSRPTSIACPACDMRFVRLQAALDHLYAKGDEAHRALRTTHGLATTPDAAACEAEESSATASTASAAAPQGDSKRKRRRRQQDGDVLCPACNGSFSTWAGMKQHLACKTDREHAEYRKARDIPHGCAALIDDALLSDGPRAPKQQTPAASDQRARASSASPSAPRSAPPEPQCAAAPPEAPSAPPPQEAAAAGPSAGNAPIDGASCASGPSVPRPQVLPKHGQAMAPQCSMVRIELPPTVHPGQKCVFSLPDGRRITVMVPSLEQLENWGEGRRGITVHVPQAAAVAPH